MNHVFISYSLEQQDQALALKGQLNEARIVAFVDSGLAVSQHAVVPGEAWRDKLRAKIDECFAVVLICTDASMQSFEVCFEWSYAMGRGITVIPLVYESGCRLHSRLDVTPAT